MKAKNDIGYASTQETHVPKDSTNEPNENDYTTAELNVYGPDTDLVSSMLGVLPSEIADYLQESFFHPKSFTSYGQG